MDLVKKALGNIMNMPKVEKQPKFKFEFDFAEETKETLGKATKKNAEFVGRATKEFENRTLFGGLKS